MSEDYETRSFNTMVLRNPYDVEEWEYALNEALNFMMKENHPFRWAHHECENGHDMFSYEFIGPDGKVTDTRDFVIKLQYDLNHDIAVVLIDSDTQEHVPQAWSIFHLMFKAAMCWLKNEKFRLMTDQAKAQYLTGLPDNYFYSLVAEALTSEEREQLISTGMCDNVVRKEDA